MLAGHLAAVAQEGSFCDHPTVHRAAPRAKSISAPAHKGLPLNWSHRSWRVSLRHPSSACRDAWTR